MTGEKKKNIRKVLSFITLTELSTHIVSYLMVSF